MSSPGSPRAVPRCKVIWFELYADDIDRASRFYHRVFGWTTRPFLDHDPTGGYLMVSYRPDERPQGAIVRRGPSSKDATSARQCILYVEVPELSAAIEAATEAGGELVEDRRLVGTDPGGGLFCILRDSEGNLLGIWSDG